MLATMRVLDGNGHTTVVCDLDSPDTATADTVTWQEFERQFRHFTDHKYHAFVMPKDGSPGEPIKTLDEFDPATGASLRVFPAMVGG